MGLSRAWAPAPGTGRKLSLPSTTASNCRLSWSSFHSWSQTLLSPSTRDCLLRRAKGNEHSLVLLRLNLWRSSDALPNCSDSPEQWSPLQLTAHWRMEVSSATRILPRPLPLEYIDMLSGGKKESQTNKQSKNPISTTEQTEEASGLVF